MLKIRPMHREQKWYSVEEEKFIQQHMDSMTYKEIGRILDRGEDSIKQKALRLRKRGLNRREHLTQDEKMDLKEVAKNMDLSSRMLQVKF